MKIIDLHLDLLHPVIEAIKNGQSANIENYIGDFSIYQGLCANYYFEGGNAHSELLQLLNYIKVIQQNSPNVVFVKQATDLNKKGFKIILCIEGLAPVRTIDDIKKIFDSGVRQICLTWNDKNLLGSGGNHAGGLTQLGKEAVLLFNQLGGIIDISHASKQTANDILKISNKVLASHVLSNHIFPHFRNLSDEILLKIKAKAGIVGMTPAYFIGENRSFQTFLQHVKHIVAVVGIEHVGLASDFLYFLPDYQKSSVDWFANVADFKKLSRFLADYFKSELLLADNYIMFLQRKLN